MKKVSPQFLMAIFSCAVATSLCGGPLKSDIIAAGAQKQIDVPEGIFLKIRSFTQEGGNDRAVVTATIGSQTTKVLSAARIDTATAATPTPTPSATPFPTPTPTPTPSPTPTPPSSTLEPLNGIIIAGPAMVTITAADVDAFVTYKKDKNSFD